MSKYNTTGVCHFCNKPYSGRGITRHLSSHLKALEAERKSRSQALHIKVEAGEMFLHLLLADTANLATIDSFLRAIWLECCGHMSSFNIVGMEYGWDSDYGEPMSRKVGDIFRSKTKVDYTYDFGSSTDLRLKLVNSYSFKPKKQLTLLSRNEPLPIRCDRCKTRIAEEICAVSGWKEETFFCKTCAPEHAKVCPDFADYASMPVVNSPRMGTCGYRGGQIDKKRNGVYQD